MYYFELTTRGEICYIFSVPPNYTEIEVKERIYSANRTAGFLRFIIESDISHYLPELITYAKEQQENSNRLALKLRAAELYGEE